MSMKVLFFFLYPTVASLDNSVGLNLEAAIKHFNEQHTILKGNLANMLPVFPITRAFTGKTGTRRQLADASKACEWTTEDKWGGSNAPKSCQPVCMWVVCV